MAGQHNGNGYGHGPSNGSAPTNGAGRSGSDKGDSYSGLGDRLPPQNIEAEQAVLGSLLLENDFLHEVVTFLDVKDFYRDTHQTIYRAILDLYDLGKAIDAITLSEELTRREQYKAIGGEETLRQIIDA